MSDAWEEDEVLSDQDAICPRCGGETFLEEEYDDVSMDMAEMLRCITCGEVLKIMYSDG